MAEPYEQKKGKPTFYTEKRAVTGKIVALLHLRMDNRGLSLIQQASRAVRSGEIVEIITTDERTATRGSKVDRVAYIGFAEIETGGVILIGDSVTIGGERIGEVCGFDETHAPNHINVVIHATELKTAPERNITLFAPIEFTLPKP
jgi:hypothetical protein